MLVRRSEETVSAGVFHPGSLSAATVVRYQDRWQGEVKKGWDRCMAYAPARRDVS